MKKPTTESVGQTWEYRGVVITVSGSGIFTAAGPNKERITATSLRSAQEKIDKVLTVGFEPFGEISWTRPYCSDYQIVEPTPGKINKEPFQVTLLEKSYSGRGHHFIVEKGSHNKHESTVIPDTPENRAALQTYIDMLHANNLKRVAFRRQEKELFSKILFIKADDYAIGDKTPKPQD